MAFKVRKNRRVMTGLIVCLIAMALIVLCALAFAGGGSETLKQPKNQMQISWAWDTLRLCAAPVTADGGGSET